MSLFHHKLKQIKKNKNGKHIIIKFDSNEIILKLVDTSEDTINLLYRLRKKYRNMFATDFHMTKEKTKEWINKLILENPERVLFIIYLNNTKIGCIGHGGFDEKNNSSQLDNMMKDPTCKISGIMTVVEKVYLNWMFDFFNLSKITGYLFSDNERMMNIHKECGWVLVGDVPIKKNSYDDCTRWEEIKNFSNNENAERYFNIIEIRKENLMKNFNKIEYESQRYFMEDHL